MKRYSVRGFLQTEQMVALETCSLAFSIHSLLLHIYIVCPLNGIANPVSSSSFTASCTGLLQTVQTPTTLLKVNCHIAAYPLLLHS